jgi:hypothetical protein
VPVADCGNGMFERSFTSGGGLWITAGFIKLDGASVQRCNFVNVATLGSRITDVRHGKHQNPYAHQMADTSIARQNHQRLSPGVASNCSIPRLKRLKTVVRPLAAAFRYQQAAIFAVGLANMWRTDQSAPGAIERFHHRRHHDVNTRTIGDRELRA